MIIMNGFALYFIKWNDIFSRQSPKFHHYVSESSRLAIRLNNITLIETVVNTLTKLRDEITDGRKKFVEEALVSLLTKYPKIAKQNRELFEKVLSSVVMDDTCTNRQEYFRHKLKLLYTVKKYDALLAAAYQMYELFPKDACSLGN